MVAQSVSGKHKVGLRPLNPVRDLSQLADLIESAFGDELSDEGLGVLRELRFLAALGPLNVFITGTQSEINDLFTGFVWVQEDRVIGNVTVNCPTGHPRRWQISNVAVLEAYRCRGIARQLVEAAIDLILRRGGNTAYLYVQDENTPARHLYKSLGFAEMDRITDLALNKPIPESKVPLFSLRPLGPKEGERLYKLVLEADSVGRRWLFPAHQSQFVISQSESFLRHIEALFSGETETHWGTFFENRLDVGLVLYTTRGLNRKAHRFKLWTRPLQSRQEIEYSRIAQDVLTILGKKARRPVCASLPTNESQMIDALVQYGFRKQRTLILMKLDL